MSSINRKKNSVKEGDVRNPNYHKKIKRRSEKEIEKRTKI
jgi:hypothetical protein